jgi:hypothetical protein
MDLVERNLTAKVPPNAATALAAIQVNMGGACACTGRVNSDFPAGGSDYLDFAAIATRCRRTRSAGSRSSDRQEQAA